ncbi:2-succinyl-6-hydroxy-2,4-cyclohexadiene-1-carboxylate synthase [Enterovibrio sp. ZSDZ42]|uniref:Putative 2-succinyl-6-hydroxy-2,4-cyclohexadiene-1-carboxylate synthase n=1 Tax=Enterovibrio gelatinilyticus TaxID=2899819 RepID=A0ABT5QYC1_9GAMM|nr:2-succinyl-6-hydroxy-2,4-cyclohexadiene-1-carboxylate synthase [Enterovibrio sp. ZSDZ42]MDD1793011.1 2-succinyl-6-hydroxy-2,4-cyclohexadiene-1-carboxylate synthase [Enterovibrio sp. ZSDZ42]
MPTCCSQLSARLSGAKDRPAVVFLHGLLGSGKDWQGVVDILEQDFTCLTIDLPGHGESKNVCVKGVGETDGFEDTGKLVIQAIQSHLNQPFWLVGYSLGARIGMYMCAFQRYALARGKANLQGLIIESGHTGLPVNERGARLENDERWARRFADEPMVDVLQDWYQQAVFSSLNHEQKQSLVTIRSDNLGTEVASMLRATSLAKQPLLIEPLRTSGLPLYYFCGENDPKFGALAMHSGFEFLTIPDAGHNIHAEQATLYSQHVKRLINKLTN